MTDINKTIEDAWQQAAAGAMLPFESWERLRGESSAAYGAFCVYRDLGPERNIRKAVEAYEKDEGKSGKRYGMWRVWAAKFRWRERGTDYDRYLEGLKQTEVRKTVEDQGKVQRMVTGKMLQVVYKKLELMNPEDLTQGTVKEWVETAIRAERESAGLVATNGSKSERQQGEINFTPEFNGL
jgi:hypothetical protein